MNKAARIISIAVYGIGLLVTLTLCIVALFGSAQPVNPDSMLPISHKEQAFIWLGAGAAPMLLACAAVYQYGGIKKSAKKRRNFVLVFLPGFICGACALYFLGAAGILLFKSLVLR